MHLNFQIMMLICSGNPGLESQQRLAKIPKLVDELSTLRASGTKASSRLAGSGPQWDVKPRHKLYNILYHVL